MEGGFVCVCVGQHILKHFNRKKERAVVVMQARVTDL